MADLNRLIDEVLSMAKDSQNLRKKKQKDDESSAVNQSWDDTPAGQAYWKDIRGRNTQMEVGRMQNAGQMDVARENNTGQLARQTLMEDTKRIDDARDYNLDLYKTQIGENVGRFDSPTKRMEAITKQDALNRPDGSKEDPRAALFTALSQPGMTEPEKVNIRKTFDSIYGGGQPATQPAGSQRNIPPPDGILSDKKPSDVIKPASRGVDSMEFASDDVLKKRKLMERNKKVEEDMFGKPKRSSFFPW
jgi:hypothetical protein